MSLKDRIHDLEKQLADEREIEIRKKCEYLAQDARKTAVNLVEDAIKYKRYEVKTTGFFRNKRTIKSVSGHTHCIVMHFGWPSPTPEKYRSDGSTEIVVGSKKEFDILMDCITKELEREGFACGTSQPEYGRGIYINYKMEWE